MSKKRLIKRLEWYYPTEKFHTYGTLPLILILILIFNQFKNVFFLLYGLLVCNYILYQGQLYWKLKLMKLKNKPFKQKINIDFFKTSKRNNIILIGIMPVIFLIQYYTSNMIFKPKNLIVWALIANLFAIAEYVNYYHIQLSIDNKYDLYYLLKHRRFKKSKLAKDLSEGEI